jgi:hypothetical protein
LSFEFANRFERCLELVIVGECAAHWGDALGAQTVAIGHGRSNTGQRDEPVVFGLFVFAKLLKLFGCVVLDCLFA